MSLLSGITTLTTNLGVEWTSLIIIVFLAGMPIFFARDARVGLVVLLLLSSGLFVWFYTAGYDWTKPLWIAVIAIILLALTLIGHMSSRQNMQVY